MKVEINSEGMAALGTEIKLDDNNVEEGVQSAKIKFEANDINRLELEILPDAIELETDAEVIAKLGDKKYKLEPLGEEEQNAEN